MGEFAPQLLDEGFQPRVILEYPGTLFCGLHQMSATDALDALARLTSDERNRRSLLANSQWLPLSFKSETPPPFCSSRSPVSHVPKAGFLRGTPLGFAAVRTQGKQFVGWAERAVTILQ
jgi:hypothetical protein